MEGTGIRRLVWAILVNVLLTVVQIIGGVISGSLALIADALHNFSDAASLVIALVARQWAAKPADALWTFGYRRAELMGAMINLTTLILIGIYLLFEAILRFIQPEPITGWVVVVIAGIALAVDVITTVLTYSLARNSLNMRAVFLHNMADALSSVAVIIAGALILLYQWYFVDALCTFLIAGYVLYHGCMVVSENGKQSTLSSIMPFSRQAGGGMARTICEPLEDAAPFYRPCAGTFLTQGDQVLLQMQQRFHAHFHLLDVVLQ